VKELTISTIRADKVVELFEREIKVLKQIQHPRIPSYIERVTTEHGKVRSIFIVMQYVEGSTLEQELESKRYTEAAVRGICLELGTILEHLHSLSPAVVHRDIKPANVMRSTDGALWLIDFGAVKDHGGPGQDGQTIVGSLGHMAPEQLHGEASPASDIYAVGALAVTLLTRLKPRTLLDASGRLAWHQHANVSSEFAGALDLMLSWNPDSRPSSVREALAYKENAIQRSLPGGSESNEALVKTGVSEGALWFGVITVIVASGFVSLFATGLIGLAAYFSAGAP